MKKTGIVISALLCPLLATPPLWAAESAMEQALGTPNAVNAADADNISEAEPDQGGYKGLGTTGTWVLAGATAAVLYDRGAFDNTDDEWKNWDSQDWGLVLLVITVTVLTAVLEGKNRSDREKQEAQEEESTPVGLRLTPERLLLTADFRF